MGEKWGRWEKVFFFILDKMAGGHFVCPKITFDHSSCHFRSIRNFFFFLIFEQIFFWIGPQCQLSKNEGIIG